MTRRTWEEREALVRQWRESGKKMSDWCRERQIPITTFCGWAYRKKRPNRNTIVSRSDFTELKNEVSGAKVLIEWLGCKIHIDSQNASQILEKCLSIIGRLSC
jgi:hypothetical protein